MCDMCDTICVICLHKNHIIDLKADLETSYGISYNLYIRIQYFEAPRVPQFLDARDR